MSSGNDGLWFVIRRRDIFEYNSTQSKSTQSTSTQSSISDSIIHQSVLPPKSTTFEELKATVFSWINIEDNNTKIVKLRRYDNALVPYSALLEGSTKDKPFIIEVVDAHQFCPVERRTTPAEVNEALKLKVKELEKRIEALEEKIPTFTATHIKETEEEAQRLVNQLEFLSRRIDELTPANWPT